MFVKSPVFPFVRFPGVDTILGPEMKSTGEVMGGADNFGVGVREGAAVGGAAAARQRARAFISVNNDDKPNVLPIARDLAELGFTLVATRGTAAYLRAHGLDVEVVYKVNEGRPNVADQIVNGKIASDRQHAARPRVVLRRPRRAPRRDDARACRASPR